MLDLLERDSTTWHRTREAAFEKKLLCFDLVPNRITTTSANFTIYRPRFQAAGSSRCARTTT